MMQWAINNECVNSLCLKKHKESCAASWSHNFLIKCLRGGLWDLIQPKKNEPQLEGIQWSFNLWKVRDKRKLELKLLRRRTAERKFLRVIFPRENFQSWELFTWSGSSRSFLSRSKDWTTKKSGLRSRNPDPASTVFELLCVSLLTLHNHDAAGRLDPFLRVCCEKCDALLRFSIATNCWNR